MSHLHNDVLRNIFYGDGKNNGINFYDHLVSLLSEIDSRKDVANGLDDIEKISNFLKMNKFVHSQPQSDEELRQAKAGDEQGTKQFSLQCEEFLKVRKTKKICLGNCV